MKCKRKTLQSAVVLSFLTAADAGAQGTFQNLGFENGTFVPIPGDPFGRVEFSAAMPGWTGYLGTNQINWIFHNNRFIDTADIAIFGPDYPAPDIFEGHYYVNMQNGFDPLDMTRMVTPSISQVGAIPADAQSIRLLYGNSFAIGVDISFDGISVPLWRTNQIRSARELVDWKTG